MILIAKTIVAYASKSEKIDIFTIYLRLPTF